MKRYVYALLLYASSLHCELTHSPHVISMTFKEYPTLHALAHPDTKTPPNVDGINATYFGFLNTTGYDGDLIFPRRHQEPTITLLVSTDVQPIFMASNTIAFWQLNQNAIYALYTIEKQQDQETQKWFWNITKATPPDKGRLPINTIVLFAEPTAIYVPEGITISDSNQQLVLPALYVKQTIQRPEGTMKALEQSPFFKRIAMDYKKEKTGIQAQAQ